MLIVVLHNVGFRLSCGFGQLNRSVIYERVGFGSSLGVGAHALSWLPCSMVEQKADLGSARKLTFKVTGTGSVHPSAFLAVLIRNLQINYRICRKITSLRRLELLATESSTCNFA